MTIEEFKSKLELLQAGVNEKKTELFNLIQTESEFDKIESEEERKSAVVAFEEKTAALIEEINALEESASKEYRKFKAVNPVEFNLALAAKSFNGGEGINTSGLEELLTSLSVKTNQTSVNGGKKSIGTYLGEYVVNGLGIKDEESASRKLRNAVDFTFQLSNDDAIGEAEVKSLPQVKGLYINGGTELVIAGVPVPGFQGYGCSVFEIEDGCMPCIYPRNFRDCLTVRTMPTGNIIQYDFPLNNTVTSNAGSVPEMIHNPYPTVVQNGRKPESTFTYRTAKVAVSKIAHWIEASQEVLEDCSKVADRIDFHLTTGLTLETDRQLIAGTGTNGELLGLLLQPGKLTLNGNTITAGIVSPNIWDKLYTAMLMLEQNCAKVDCVIVNPLDRAKVILAKNDNGNYLFPQATMANCDITDAAIGCLTLKTSPDVPVGTALIGEFKDNWIYYIRKNLQVSVGMKGTDFIDNILTFLAEIRGAAILRCPQRVAIVTNI